MGITDHLPNVEYIRQIVSPVKIKVMKDQLIKLYLDWCNNFISLSGISEYYGIDIVDMDQLIHIGRKLHHERVEQLNSK